MEPVRAKGMTIVIDTQHQEREALNRLICALTTWMLFNWRDGIRFRIERLSNVVVLFFFSHLRLADLVKRLSDYDVVVPRKVSERGQLLSHQLTHHYDDASRRQRRRRRQVDDASDDVHYRLELSGREKQLHLKPNDRLLASAFVVERRQGRNVTNHRLMSARHKQCHYIGQVKGHPESTVAVSTCNGLVSGKLVWPSVLKKKKGEGGRVVLDWYELHRYWVNSNQIYSIRLPSCRTTGGLANPIKSACTVPVDWTCPTWWMPIVSIFFPFFFFLLFLSNVPVSGESGREKKKGEWLDVLKGS